MKYIIIHGTMGNSQENWFPWLKSHLESLGHTVHIPDFPTPTNQNLTAWTNVLQDQGLLDFDSDTILIGHSLGAAYIINLLDEERNIPLKKAILVAGFTKALGYKEYDDLNASFLQDEYDRDRIKNNVNDIVIFQGDNDPFVPVSEAEFLHKKLGGTIKIIPKGGHLNARAGFTQFEEILKYL